MVKNSYGKNTLMCTANEYMYFDYFSVVDTNFDIFSVNDEYIKFLNDFISVKMILALFCIYRSNLWLKFVTIFYIFLRLAGFIDALYNHSGDTVFVD